MRECMLDKETREGQSDTLGKDEYIGALLSNACNLWCIIMERNVAVKMMWLSKER